MKLHDKDAFNFLAEEDQLTLHLSEPHFTKKQRFIRKMKQLYYFCKNWVV